MVVWGRMEVKVVVPLTVKRVRFFLVWGRIGVLRGYNTEVILQRYTVLWKS